MTAPTTYANPYWDKVRDLVRLDLWDRTPIVDQYRPENVAVNRHKLVSEYAWTITDPDTVAFVVKHCGPSVVDPLAGSGYWAWLLGQHGVDVAASDLKPGASIWHRHGVHLPVVGQEGPLAVRLAGPERTLLLSWPPYDEPVGAELVEAYQGDRIVYIGEGPYGCCGDDRMWQLLKAGWAEVASHRPVQWYGLRDWVTVYERRSGDAR
jgi:hypothetical protein